MPTEQNLSRTARRILQKMRDGMILAIRRDPDQGANRLMNFPGHKAGEDQDVTPEVFDELLKAGLISELPEQRTRNRIGWREAGLPGDLYYIYACVQ